MRMKILVATDGSRAAFAAVKFAARLAESNPNAELVVVTVDSTADKGTPTNAQGSPDAVERVLKEAAKQVGESKAHARFLVAAAHSADEIPQAISREADRLDADVIVVGSEGRDSLREWIVGGTALRLIYVARRPVTVVRAPRRRVRA